MLGERDADPHRLQPTPELFPRRGGVLSPDAEEGARVAVRAVDRVDVAAAGLAADEGVDLGGERAGVDTPVPHRHVGAPLVRPTLVEHRHEFGPDL